MSEIRYPKLLLDRLPEITLTSALIMQKVNNNKVLRKFITKLGSRWSRAHLVNGAFRTLKCVVGFEKGVRQKLINGNICRI